MRNGARAFLWPAVAGLLLAADAPGPLEGTAPLTTQGDIASDLVAGVDRFLLRKTAEARGRRDQAWVRDVSSEAAYRASVEPHRKRLAHILGVRDARVPFEAPELVATTAKGARVGGSDRFDAFAVRWPAFGEVSGEGLLLVPKGVRRADVVAVADADQTPEQVAGLAEGVPPESQFARRLAESGCRVVVPTLVDRRVEARNGRARLSSREFLYRSAFEMGRHVIGYEVQKVLAAVDWFVREGGRPVGVFGHGEGGLIALHSGALDPRIKAVGVSGYFDARESLWREPLDRNVFGLLERFGDAEVAAMIAPAALIVEAARGPEVVVPPGTGGGPGRLTTPEVGSVRAEFERALGLVRGLNPAPGFVLVESGGGGGPFGSEPALAAFLKALDGGGLTPAGAAPSGEFTKAEAEARQARQVRAIDRHNQALLGESAAVRQAYFSKLDFTSPEAFAKTVEPYRAAFRDEVIGAFDGPLLSAKPRSRPFCDDPAFTGHEVVLDVWDGVIAYGILLVPKGIKGGERRPVVVCQHGLEGRPTDVADPKVNNPAYNQFAVQLARRGFVTFAPQNLYLFQDRFRTLQRKANPLKASLFSVIVPQHRQITGWLKGLPFVDGGRVAFYGLSYGGKSAMRIPPLVPDYCLSICSADFNEWVWKNASSRSPYSYVWTPEYEIFEFDLGNTFNYAEMAALIAPRQFMVERGHFDTVAPDEMVAHEFAKVRFLYEAKLGLKGRCELEWFVGPHTIHGVGTFDFLHRHLNWPKP